MKRRKFLASRRDILRAAAGTAVGLSWARRRTYAARPDRYVGLRSSRYLGPVDVSATVRDGAVFTEGPAVDRAGNVFFTNVRASKILRFNPITGQLAVFRENSHATNGLLFDPHGRLLACEGDAGRITRTDMKTGKIEVLVDEFHRFALAPPNDLCLDGQGALYFTSRPGTDDPKKGNPNAVYRVELDALGLDPHPVRQILRWPDIHMPNGIVTSPDDKILYIIEAHSDADHHRDIRAYDLEPDGTVTNERVVIDFYPGRSGDGMCIDARGNLYVAAGLHKTRKTSETLDTRPGIHVVAPSGKLLAYRETPEDTVTNCTFGGEDLRTLYVTCGTKLLSLRTEIPGKPGYRPLA